MSFLSAILQRLPGSFGLRRGLAWSVGEIAAANLPLCNAAREGEERRISGSIKVRCDKTSASTYAWRDEAHRFNAKAFGAKGDGVNDDTAAANAAITAALAAGGGDVFFPAGTFLLGEGALANIALSCAGDGVAISGAGMGVTTLKLADGADSHVLQVSDDGNTIRDLTIDGNRANQTLGVHGIRMHGTRHRIERVHVKDAAHYAIGLGQQTGSTVEQCVLHDVHISGSGADGIDVKNKANTNTANSLSAITVESFGLNAALAVQAGIDLRGPCHVAGVTVRGVNDDLCGIRFREGETSDPNGLGAHESTLTGFHVSGDGTGDSPIGVQVGARHVAISNGYIVDVWRGVQTTSLAEDPVIAAAHVESAALDGFRIDATPRVTLIGCVVDGATDDGYQIDGADACLFGCTAMNCTSRGLEIGGAASGTYVSAMRFSGNGANVSNAGTATVIRDTPGYVTRNAGVTSVADGGTISHGLAATPTRYGATPTVSGEFVSITAVSGTTMTVAIKKHDGTAGTTQNIAWWAEV